MPKSVERIISKRKKKNVAKGKRYQEAAKKTAKKAEKTMRKAKKGQSYNRKKQVKAMTQAQTAENLMKAGKKAVASGGTSRPKKKKELKVTPKSAARKEAEKNPQMLPGYKQKKR